MHQWEILLLQELVNSTLTQILRPINTPLKRENKPRHKILKKKISLSFQEKSKHIR